MSVVPAIVAIIKDTKDSAVLDEYQRALNEQRLELERERDVAACVALRAHLLATYGKLVPFKAMIDTLEVVPSFFSMRDEHGTKFFYWAKDRTHFCSATGLASDAMKLSRHHTPSFSCAGAMTAYSRDAVYMLYALHDNDIDLRTQLLMLKK